MSGLLDFLRSSSRSSGTGISITVVGVVAVVLVVAVVAVVVVVLVVAALVAVVAAAVVVVVALVVAVVVAGVVVVAVAVERTPFEHSYHNKRNDAVTQQLRENGHSAENRPCGARAQPPAADNGRLHSRGPIRPSSPQRCAPSTP